MYWCIKPAKIEYPHEYSIEVKNDVTMYLISPYKDHITNSFVFNFVPPDWHYGFQH